MSKPTTLSITEEGFLALIAEHVAATLPPDKVEQLAEQAIARRVGMLTLEQAARHLQCKNVRQLTDFCREQKIPIQHFGAKKRFILLSEIEAAQKRTRLALAPETSTGTVIARVLPDPKGRAVA